MSSESPSVIAAVATEVIRQSSRPCRSDVIEDITERIANATKSDVDEVLTILCIEDHTDDGVYLSLRDGSLPKGDGVINNTASGENDSSNRAGDSEQMTAPTEANGSDQSATPVGDPTEDSFGQLTVLEDIGHEKVPDVGVDAYYERETVADKTDVQIVTRALEEGMNVVLKGPPGVGKSYLAKYVCSQTNRPLYRVTLSETTYREDLLGHLQLVSAPGGESVTSWVDGPLTRAAREGGVLLLDEINAADANTAAALNAVMERETTRSLTIPQTGEVVEPHEEFRVIATSNPGYQGTYEQNEAFEGRFRHVELDYVPADVEVNIIFERTDLDQRKRKQVEDLVDFADRLREAYVNGELTTPITTRELVRIATFMEGGFMDLRTATRSELLARVDDHDRSLVATLVEKSL